MTEHTSARPRAGRLSLPLVGAAAGIALAVATPLAASAHVTVTPDSATAGGSGVLTFAFSHGCEGSPTTALRIELPDGITSVTPTIAPGWTIDVERGGTAHDGLVERVTYTADSPVPSGYRAALELSVGFGEDTAGETLAFPVTQVCEQGEVAWAEVAEDGVDPHSLDAPAPVVAVASAAAAADESAAGHAGHGSGPTAGDETDAAAAAPAPTSVAPVVFGAAGLGAGVAALAVSLVALARTRRRS